MNHIPYPCRFTTTRTGLRIGAAYIPKPRALTRDGELVQAALLDPRTARRPTVTQRLLGFFWRHA